MDQDIHLVPAQGRRLADPNDREPGTTALRSSIAPPVDAVSFEGASVDEPTFLKVLAQSISAVERAGVPYAVIGGIASSILGRPRWTHDVDLFLRDQHDAAKVLESLALAGFATQRTDDHWLYKSINSGVLVDLIFKAKGEIYLDDEMISRAKVGHFKSVPLNVVSPEDLIVVKALVHDEQSPRHWHDAVCMIGQSDLDWEYLLRRARSGARRVLSLLLYAESSDAVVPEAVMRSLFSSIYDV